MEIPTIEYLNQLKILSEVWQRRIQGCQLLRMERERIKMKTTVNKSFLYVENLNVRDMAI